MLVESGFLGFVVLNTAQGVRNPTNNRLISQQNGNVSRRRESARKRLSATSGAQFAFLRLAIPVV